MIQQEQRTVKIHIPNELGYEKVVRSAVAIIAQQMAFNNDKIEDLKTAVCEACTNAIEHGNAAKLDTRVKVVVLFDRHHIQVDIIDHGLHPLPNEIPDKADRTDFRGMGFFLMKALVDRLELISQPGRNVVRLTCQNADLPLFT